MSTPTSFPAADRYDSMTYRRCGRSGLRLPAISLGLWHNFGAHHAFANMREMLRGAFDLGITHFDLANGYGPPPGSAEENFGRILCKDFGGLRDELIISSKAGFPMWPGPYGEWGSRKYVLASLDQSLQRTGLDYFDIFYSHRPDPDTPLEETMSALADAVRMGKAIYAGISSYSPEQTSRAAEILRGFGVPLLIHQPAYNIYARGPEEGGLFDVLDHAGAGCIVFCPLAQGLLTDRYLAGIPSDSRAADPSGFLQEERITEAVIAQTRALNAIALARGQSLAQMSLAWTLRRPTVTSALIGASRLSQIQENVKALDKLEFSLEELAAIDRASRSAS